MKTRREKNRAEAKVNKAIDAMIDLKDAGFGCDSIERILELLNTLRNKVSQ